MRLEDCLAHWDELQCWTQDQIKGCQLVIARCKKYNIPDVAIHLENQILGYAHVLEKIADMKV